jgi:hypothetical protein
MRHMKTIAIISVLAAIAVGTGQALAANHHHAGTKTLVVGMHDPGCHWFVSHGKFTKTASLKGPVRLVNHDEAALKVASRTGTRHIKVGKSLIVRRGSYVVMMVNQAADDNYLKLTVK